jgi:hypothetical protein
MTVHEVATAFDPAVHGFHFSNRFSGLDIIEEVNDGFVDIVRSVPVPDSFWEGWGLCGGMSWHALDRYYARNAVPPQTTRPGAGSVLFKVFVARQVDSLRRWRLINACIDWQARPDQQVWWVPRRSIGAKTTKQWPSIKASIDRGLPASLTLIRGTTDPSKNHQVVAIGYRFDDVAKRVEIDLYDPNRPEQKPHLVILLGRPNHRIEASQSTGEELRGFFHWPYDRSRRVV